VLKRSSGIASAMAVTLLLIADVYIYAHGACPLLECERVNNTLHTNSQPVAASPQSYEQVTYIGHLQCDRSHILVGVLFTFTKVER
jgi:hypothetical protein